MLNSRANAQFPAPVPYHVGEVVQVVRASIRQRRLCEVRRSGVIVVVLDSDAEGARRWGAERGGIFFRVYVFGVVL